MKTSIPDELKAAVPQTTWGRILTATPVIMTVVATLLAGLASSEMTRAQYDRSLAAQQQSKAGDQWSYFQAKRLRGSLQRSTLDILESAAPGQAFSAEAFKRSIADLPVTTYQPEAARAKTDLLILIDSTNGQHTLALLQNEELPPLPAAADAPGKLPAALEALENSKPESDITAALSSVGVRTLEEALVEAVARAQAYDAELSPVNRAVGQMQTLLNRLGSELLHSVTVPAGTGPLLSRDFTLARLRYAALRYDAESRLNQDIAALYELQVRKSNSSAERHHRRSQRFFFGMLAAQAAVIIATFSIAAQKRSLLWSLAAAAGLAAIAFAIYVYFYI